MKSPSVKQIELADKIAKKLNLDFPKSDYDFTAQRYWSFIKDNIREYRHNQFSYTEEDVFFGYTEGLWEY